MVRVMIAKEGIEKLLDLLTAGLVEYNQSMGGWWKGGFNVGFSVTDGQTRSKTRYIPVHLTGESRPRDTVDCTENHPWKSEIRFCSFQCTMAHNLKRKMHPRGSFIQVGHEFDFQIHGCDSICNDWFPESNSLSFMSTYKRLLHVCNKHVVGNSGEYLSLAYKSCIAV